MFSISGIGNRNKFTNSPNRNNPFLSLVVLWCLGIDWDENALVLINSEPNILSLLYQEVTITNCLQELLDWKTEQENRLKREMSTIKIPRKLLAESRLKYSSEKKRRKSKKRRNSKEKKYINTGTDNLLSDNSTTGIATADAKNSNNDDQTQISTAAVAVNLSSQSSSIDATLQPPVSPIATSTPENVNSNVDGNKIVSSKPETVDEMRGNNAEVRMKNKKN